MNNLRNSVRLIGNLGTDPEVREMEQGKKFARFSLATSEIYKGEDGKKVIDLQWHNIVALGRQAEAAGKMLKKGSGIAVEGKLSSRSYTDLDGNLRYITEIIASDFKILGRTNKGPAIAA